MRLAISFDGASKPYQLISRHSPKLNGGVGTRHCENDYTFFLSCRVSSAATFCASMPKPAASNTDFKTVRRTVMYWLLPGVTFFSRAFFALVWRVFRSLQSLANAADILRK